MGDDVSSNVGNSGSDVDTEPAKEAGKGEPSIRTMIVKELAGIAGELADKRLELHQERALIKMPEPLPIDVRIALLEEKAATIEYYGWYAVGFLVGIGILALLGRRNG